MEEDPLLSVEMVEVLCPLQVGLEEAGWRTMVEEEEMVGKEVEGEKRMEGVAEMKAQEVVPRRMGWDHYRCPWQQSYRGRRLVA